MEKVSVRKTFGLLFSGKFSKVCLSYIAMGHRSCSTIDTSLSKENILQLEDMADIPPTTTGCGVKLEQ